MSVPSRLSYYALLHSADRMVSAANVSPGSCPLQSREFSCLSFRMMDLVEQGSVQVTFDRRLLPTTYSAPNSGCITPTVIVHQSR